MRTLADDLDKDVVTLHKLHAPDDVRRQYDAYLGSLSATADAARAIDQVVRSGEAKRLSPAADRFQAEVDAGGRRPGRAARRAQPRVIQRTSRPLPTRSIRPCANSAAASASPSAPAEVRRVLGRVEALEGEPPPAGLDVAHAVAGEHVPVEHVDAAVVVGEQRAARDQFAVERDAQRARRGGRNTSATGRRAGAAPAARRRSGRAAPATGPRPARARRSPPGPGARPRPHPPRAAAAVPPTSRGATPRAPPRAG